MTETEQQHICPHCGKPTPNKEYVKLPIHSPTTRYHLECVYGKEWANGYRKWKRNHDRQLVVIDYTIAVTWLYVIGLVSYHVMDFLFG